MFYNDDNDDLRAVRGCINGVFSGGLIWLALIFLLAGCGGVPQIVVYELRFSPAGKTETMTQGIPPPPMQGSKVYRRQEAGPGCFADPTCIIFRNQSRSRVWFKVGGLEAEAIESGAATDNRYFDFGHYNIEVFEDVDTRLFGTRRRRIRAFSLNITEGRRPSPVITLP